MVNPLESLNNFVDKVGNQINLTFKGIDDFIDSVITFFVSGGYWISALTFFLLFALIIYLPIMLFRYWEDIRTRYDSLTKSIISSITSK